MTALPAPLPPLGDPSITPATRVVSIPAGHPYVQRICANDGVRLLDDPPPVGAAPGVWWPPVALDAEWITAHRADADLLHVHFGTESFPVERIVAAIDAAHEAGWPVVYTAHDLENPQVGAQDLYQEHLTELITRADAVLTLTPGAADEIQHRWGRDALVIPHPSILPPHAHVPTVLGSDDVRVGVHLKDLRPNVDGPGTVRALIAAVDALRSQGRPVVAEVRLHHSVRDETARDEVRRLCAGAEHTTLVEHERLSDDQLTVALSRLDVCVLPYRHGTHSGWLELCWDLGIGIAAPRIGHYLDQHPDGTVSGFAPGDAVSLAAAVAKLLDDPAHTQAASAERHHVIAERRDARDQADDEIADAHESLYRRLLDGYAG